MGWSAAAAIGAALISGYSSYQQTQASNAQAEYQAQVARANAEALRNQAEQERLAGIAEQEAIQLQKEKITRQYQEQKGKNVSLLAASGADLSSGSAADLLSGNAALYAQDVAENTYTAKLADWENRYKRQTLEWQADVQDSNASYLMSTRSSVGNSLLTSTLKGLGTGMSTYAMFGGGNPFLSKSNGMNDKILSLSKKAAKAIPGSPF